MLNNLRQVFNDKYESVFLILLISYFSISQPNIFMRTFEQFTGGNSFLTFILNVIVVIILGKKTGILGAYLKRFVIWSGISLNFFYGLLFIYILYTIIKKFY